MISHAQGALDWLALAFSPSHAHLPTPRRREVLETSPAMVPQPRTMWRRAPGDKSKPSPAQIHGINQVLRKNTTNRIHRSEQLARTMTRLRSLAVSHTPAGQQEGRWVPRPGQRPQEQENRGGHPRLTAEEGCSRPAVGQRGCLSVGFLLSSGPPWMA